MEKKAFDAEDRPKIAAFDLDGTVLKYDGNYKEDVFGEPVPDMIQQMQKIKDAGWLIVIWTCRRDSKALRKHLLKSGVPFDHVNDHPWNGPGGSPKLDADIYIDDKAIAFDGVATGLANEVLGFKSWWKLADWT